MKYYLTLPILAIIAYGVSYGLVLAVAYPVAELGHPTYKWPDMLLSVALYAVPGGLFIYVGLEQAAKRELRKRGTL